MWIRGASVGLISLVLVGCSGGTPTGPTMDGPQTPPPASRAVGVSGSLGFGEVVVGTSRELPMTIANTGTAPLNVTSLTVSNALAPHISVSWRSGTIAPGTSQTVLVRFSPTTSGAFSGTLVVNGDQTAGANSLSVSGSAISSFAGTWTGSHVSTACNGTGSAQDLICGATRGAYKVGSALYFSVSLVQHGASVSGTANIGGPQGPVSGTIVGDRLTLTGTLRDSQGFASTITSWTTTVTGGSMSGTVGYSLTYSAMPGNAGIEARLSNVTRR